MSNPTFTDADGDTYEVTASESRNLLSLSFKSPETAGTAAIIFKVEDAERIAEIVLAAAKKARK